MPTVVSFMTSGPLRSGCAVGGGGGPRRGCRRRKSWLGVCPKWLIWSSTALRCLPHTQMQASVSMHCMRTACLGNPPRDGTGLHSSAYSLQ